MIAIIKTCEHCGQEYSYYMSGELCSPPTNDEHLCQECKSAVLLALAKVPVKFYKAYENCNELISKDDIAHFIAIGEEYNAERKRASEKSGWPMMCRVMMSNDYDYFIEFYWNEQKYSLFYNTKDDYSIRAESYRKSGTSEFDRFVRYDGKKDFEILSYTKCIKTPKFDSSIPVKPLAEPIGNLFYMDTIDHFKSVKAEKKHKNYLKLKK